ncbi:hypothetical protein M9H77_04989 [Catharanthus roseus]|uniref:Uncharacterized protein n=1 Tax=Catharanthus roseus TaxID=4058 RepID=A0ACC0CFS8_CATRO|nr:hypothetical protein M9H77_04989 [Catharanthus roseus]
MISAQQNFLALITNSKTFKSLQQIHAHVLKIGLDTDLLVAGKLLLCCSTKLRDCLEYASRIFFCTPNPDVFMYNTLIRGFAESDSPENSLSTFIHMLRYSNSPPDSFSFAFALKSAANLMCPNAGSQLHCQAVVRGLNSHVFVGTTLISVYAECGLLEVSKKVFDEMPETNVVAWNALLTAYFRCHDILGAQRMFSLMPFRDLTSWNLMLAGYMKAGELELGKKLFSDMLTKDDVSWSTVITGFLHNGHFYEVFGLFKELQKAGLRPNEVSLTGVLSACAQAGALGFGKILHGFIEKSGLLWISSVNNALLDTYSKCGDVDMARLIFERMPAKKSIVSWTSMINGLAMQGYGEEAIRLFYQMVSSGIRPDEITFISILYACSHAGLIQQGCEIFCKMTREHGISASLEHYGCMVDLYGRAGQLQKAYDFVVQMPIPANAIIWRTLLGACTFYGNVDLAERVNRKLGELDPGDPGDRVLLSNIYAVAGKWDGVASVRRSMTELKIKKIPGWSMIDVDNVLYTFVASETKNKFSEEAYEKLKEIIQKLKMEGGYVPEVGSDFHDVQEEEKEDAVSKHSEKLAVAFGVARLCKGRTIRIVKNLRVCKDCHTVMKLISKIYELDIVVRDRSRFHSFKEGSCSCKEYW